MGEVTAWLESCVARMPGRVGSRVRAAFWRKRFASAGEGLGMGPGTRVTGARNISVGRDVHFGEANRLHADGPGGESLRVGDGVRTNSNVMLNADMGGVIEIGANAIIGPNAVLRASGHEYADRSRPVREQAHRSGRITVGEDVWIGANVVVLPDVTIGRGAVVGAGAVVTRDVEEWAVVAGVPARRIGTRGEEGA